MSLFDSASLVVTPNGYKEDKLYSIKPTDGSGDLVVTRATTATRVNSAGLVELVPVNLFTYSQEFNDASWVKSNSSITANATTAPDGTLTADKLIENSSNANHLVQKAISSSDSVYTFSVFAKKSERNWVVLRSVNASLQNVKAWFNIDAGTIGTLENGATANITNVGNGWYKLEMTIPSFSTGFEFRVSTSTGNNVDSYTGDGTSGIFIWGAQLVTGSSAKEYFPTTDRLNVPRLDYTNSTCPSILVEPQRTNIATYSEQFDDASWTKSSATITANTSVAPTGNTTADTLVITSGGYLLKQVTGYSAVSGQSITISIFAKNQTTDFLIFGGATAAGIDVYTIQDYGNGWYRHTRTRTFTTTATTTIQFAINQIGTHIIWGAQLEAGSYATSYIPTVASSVTRNADLTNKTGISSLIGQTEGTLYGEFRLQTATGGSAYLGLTSGSFSNFILLGKEAPNKLVFGIRANGSNIIFNSSTALTSDYVKCAIAYKSGSWAAYLNGNLMFSGTNTFTFSAALNTLGFGSTGDFASLNDKMEIKSTAIFKTRLSNTELATLTTI